MDVKINIRNTSKTRWCPKFHDLTRFSFLCAFLMVILSDTSQLCKIDIKLDDYLFKALVCGTPSCIHVGSFGEQ